MKERLRAATGSEVLAFLNGDPDDRRRRMFQVLDRFRADGILEALEFCSASDRCSVDDQYNLIYICGQRGLRSAASLVAGYLDHSEPDLRYVAADALITMGNVGLEDTVLRRLKAEKDTRIVPTLLLAVTGCVRPHVAQATLEAYVPSDDELIARCARRGLEMLEYRYRP